MVMLLAGGVALLVRGLLVLLDLVIDQSANETGTRAGHRAQAGIAANSAQDSARACATHRAGQSPLLCAAQVGAAGKQAHGYQRQDHVFHLIVSFQVTCRGTACSGTRRSRRWVRTPVFSGVYWPIAQSC